MCDLAGDAMVREQGEENIDWDASFAEECQEEGGTV